MLNSPTLWKKGESPNPGGIEQHIRFKALSLCEKGLDILADMMKNENEHPQVRLAAIKMILDRGLGLSKVHTTEDDKKALTPRTANDEELRKRIEHYEGVAKNLNVVDMKREE